jgi:GNAT superfamily N-acetyltransferase
MSLKNKAIVDPELDKDVLNRYSAIAPVLFNCNGKAVGFALPTKTGSFYRTGAIYVLPQYRKLGIAKTWIEEFFKDKKGIAYIRKGNSASVALFTSCGFKMGTKTLIINSDLFMQYLKT